MPPTAQQDVESICYKRNFLSEVIARVDFLSPIEKIEKHLPKAISKVAKQKFPIAEPKKDISQEFQFSPRGVRTIQKEIIEWNFHGKDKTKTLTLGPAAVFVRYTSYKTFEELKEEFLGFVEAVFREFSEAQGNRLGLRYINNITIENGDPLSWESYINNDMLSIFKFQPDRNAISRALSVLELNYGDLNLRYNYGMHNPDYPAVIKRKNFILDLDAYYQGIQDYSEIAGNLDRFHACIQRFFELSITDTLRGILNGKRERHSR